MEKDEDELSDSDDEEKIDLTRPNPHVHPGLLSVCDGVMYGKHVYTEISILEAENKIKEYEYNHKDLILKCCLIRRPSSGEPPSVQEYYDSVAKFLLSIGASINKECFPGDLRVPLLVQLYYEGRFTQVKLCLQSGENIEPNVRVPSSNEGLLDIAFLGLEKFMPRYAALVPDKYIHIPGRGLLYSSHYYYYQMLHIIETIHEHLNTNIRDLLFGNQRRPTVYLKDIVRYLEHFRKPYIETGMRGEIIEDQAREAPVMDGIGGGKDSAFDLLQTMCDKLVPGAQGEHPDDYIKVTELVFRYASVEGIRAWLAVCGQQMQGSENLRGIVGAIISRQYSLRNIDPRSAVEIVQMPFVRNILAKDDDVFFDMAIYRDGASSSDFTLTNLLTSPAWSILACAFLEAGAPLNLVYLRSDDGGVSHYIPDNMIAATSFIRYLEIRANSGKGDIFEDGALKWDKILAFLKELSENLKIVHTHTGEAMEEVLAFRSRNLCHLVARIKSTVPNVIPPPILQDLPKILDELTRFSSQGQELRTRYPILGADDFLGGILDRIRMSDLDSTEEEVRKHIVFAAVRCCSLPTVKHLVEKWDHPSSTTPLWYIRGEEVSKKRNHVGDDGVSTLSSTLMMALADRGPRCDPDCVPIAKFILERKWAGGDSSGLLGEGTADEQDSGPRILIHYCKVATHAEKSYRRGLAWNGVRTDESTKYLVELIAFVMAWWVKKYKREPSGAFFRDLNVIGISETFREYVITQNRLQVFINDLKRNGLDTVSIQVLPPTYTDDILWIYGEMKLDDLGKSKEYFGLILPGPNNHRPGLLCSIADLVDKMEDTEDWWYSCDAKPEMKKPSIDLDQPHIEVNIPGGILGYALLVPLAEVRALVRLYEGGTRIFHIAEVEKMTTTSKLKYIHNHFYPKHDFYGANHCQPNTAKTVGKLYIVKDTLFICG